MEGAGDFVPSDVTGLGFVDMLAVGCTVGRTEGFSDGFTVGRTVGLLVVDLVVGLSVGDADSLTGA